MYMKLFLVSLKHHTPVSIQCTPIIEVELFVFKRCFEKTDYCYCFKSTVGKRYISLFEEKSVEEGLVEAIQNYGNMKL